MVSCNTVETKNFKIVKAAGLNATSGLVTVMTNGGTKWSGCRWAGQERRKEMGFLLLSLGPWIGASFCYLS